MNGVIYHQPVEARLADLRGIIWDLDDTLYRLGEVTEHAFNIAIARAALNAGVDVPFDVAVELARNSYKTYGTSGGKVFVDRYKLDPAQFHQDYHALIDEAVIEKSVETARLFGMLNLSHILVTHGSRGWAERVVAHLGLAPHFPPARILALEDYNFRHKHQHRDSFDRALDILGLPPAQVAVVEDTLKNLEIPHKMGLLTIYLRHRRPLQPPGFLAVSADDAEEVLQSLVNARP